MAATATALAMAATMAQSASVPPTFRGAYLTTPSRVDQQQRMKSLMEQESAQAQASVYLAPYTTPPCEDKASSEHCPHGLAVHKGHLQMLHACPLAAATPGAPCLVMEDDADWSPGRLIKWVQRVVSERGDDWDLIVLGHNAVPDPGDARQRPIVPYDVREFSFRTNRTATGCHAYLVRDPLLLARSLEAKELGFRSYCIEHLNAGTSLRIVMPRENVVWQHDPAKTRTHTFDWQLVSCGLGNGFALIHFSESVAIACADPCRRGGKCTANGRKRAANGEATYAFSAGLVRGGLGSPTSTAGKTDWKEALATLRKKRLARLGGNSSYSSELSSRRNSSLYSGLYGRYGSDWSAKKGSLYSRYSTGGTASLSKWSRYFDDLNKKRASSGTESSATSLSSSRADRLAKARATLARLRHGNGRTRGGGATSPLPRRSAAQQSGDQRSMPS